MISTRTETLTRRHMTTISNYRVKQGPLHAHPVGHGPRRANRVGQSPLREHSAKTVSEDAWQHDRIELLPLNPDYEPIPVAAHEGPEMVVVGEWVATID